MKGKFLFLDIDGVLNSHQSFLLFRNIIKRDENDYDPSKESVYKWLSKEFCPISIANLHNIVKETECQIVLSSTWRLGAELDEIKSWFEGIPLIQNAIIDKTPSLRLTYQEKVLNTPRGMEIDAWLRSHNIDTYKSTEFAILDDDCDMYPYEKSGNFFHVDGHIGLDYYTAEKVIAFLTKQG